MKAYQKITGLVLALCPLCGLAAMLMIAKTANPDLFADVRAGDALAMLAEEATGQIPEGLFYYTDQGGF